MHEELIKTPVSFDDVLTKILQFLHTIASWIGGLIAALIHSILPSVTIPNDLVEAIGLMAMLTVFLVVLQIAKKLTWIIVVVGWVLITTRIVLLMIKG